MQGSVPLCMTTRILMTFSEDAGTISVDWCRRRFLVEGKGRIPPDKRVRSRRPSLSLVPRPRGIGPPERTARLWPSRTEAVPVLRLRHRPPIQEHWPETLEGLILLAPRLTLHCSYRRSGVLTILL